LADFAQHFFGSSSLAPTGHFWVHRSHTLI
jgi:hypothetical protein